MTLDEYEESLRRGENAASTATATTDTDGGESGSDLFARLFGGDGNGGDASAPKPGEYGEIRANGVQMKPEDFSGMGERGGVESALLNIQRDTGIESDYDGTWGGGLKNALYATGHAGAGRAFAGGMNKNLQFLAKGTDADGVPLEQLPDNEVDYLMDSAGANGAGGWFRRFLGAGASGAWRGEDNIMRRWDETDGAKIEDPAERKRARIEYAREIARGMIGQTETSRQRAAAELEGREETTAGAALRGLIEQGGYTLPFIAGSMLGGTPGSFLLAGGLEGADRYNELRADRLAMDTDGNIGVEAAGDEVSDAAGKALLRGIMSPTIEMVGGKAASALGGKLLGATIGKVPLFRKAGNALAATKVGRAVDAFAKRLNFLGRYTGMQGMPEEMAEELEDQVLDAAFGIDRRESEKREGETWTDRAGESFSDFFKGENLKELATSMLLMQVIGGAGGHVADRIRSRHIDGVLREVAGVDASELKYYTADEKMAAFKAWADGLTEDEIAKNFDEGAKQVNRMVSEIRRNVGENQFAETDADAPKFNAPMRTNGDGQTLADENGNPIPDFQETTDEAGRPVMRLYDAESGVTIDRIDMGDGDVQFRVTDAAGRVRAAETYQQAVERANQMLSGEYLSGAKRQYLESLTQPGRMLSGMDIVAGDSLRDVVDEIGERYGEEAAESMRRRIGNPDEDTSGQSFRYVLPDGRSGVAFVLGKIGSVEEMATAAMHEAGRHAGLDMLFDTPQKKADFLKKIDGKGIDTGAAARAMTPEQRRSFEGELADIQQRYGLASRDDVFKTPETVEELFAYFTENEFGNASLKNRFVAGLRSLYRDMFDADLSYNDADLLAMAGELNRRMRENTEAGRMTYRSAQTRLGREEEADIGNRRQGRRALREQERQRANAPAQIPYNPTAPEGTTVPRLGYDPAQTPYGPIVTPQTQAESWKYDERPGQAWGDIVRNGPNLLQQMRNGQRGRKAAENGPRSAGTETVATAPQNGAESAQGGISRQNGAQGQETTNETGNGTAEAPAQPEQGAAGTAGTETAGQVAGTAQGTEAQTAGVVRPRTRRGQNLRGYSYEDYAAHPDNGGTGDQMGAALLRFARDNGGLLRMPPNGAADPFSDWIAGFLDGNARKNRRGDYIALFGMRPRTGTNDALTENMPSDLQAYIENMIERQGPEAVVNWFLETRRNYAEWAANKRNAAHEERAAAKERDEEAAAYTDEELARRASERDAASEAEAEEDAATERQEEEWDRAEREAIEAEAREADERARREQSAPDFALESATPEQLRRERNRQVQREEIRRRQEAELRGSAGETGQTLLDLGGAEGEDLFNRTQRQTEQGSAQAGNAAPTARERLASVYAEWADGEALPAWADRLTDAEAKEYADLIDAALNVEGDDGGRAYRAVTDFEKRHEAGSPAQTRETATASAQDETRAADGADAAQTTESAENATWTDLNGRKTEMDGFASPSKGNVVKGAVVAIKNDRNTMLYEGEVISIGPKNVKILSRGEMGGDAELTFPRKDIVGVKRQSADVATQATISQDEGKGLTSAAPVAFKRGDTVMLRNSDGQYGAVTFVKDNGDGTATVQRRTANRVPYLPAKVENLTVRTGDLAASGMKRTLTEAEREAERRGRAEDKANGMDVGEANVRWRRVADPKTISDFDSRPHRKVYHSGMFVNGVGVVPPMASKVKYGQMEKPEWNDPANFGDLMESEEHPELVIQKGRDAGKFPLDKYDANGNRVGNTVPAAYAPYLHMAATPENPQFTQAWERPDVKVYEYEIDEDDTRDVDEKLKDGTAYTARGSKKSTGANKWPGGRTVYLVKMARLVREMPWSEVADMLAPEYLKNGTVVPWNTVPQELRDELRDRGVKIGDIKGYQKGPALDRVMAAKEEDERRYRERTGGEANVRWRRGDSNLDNLRRLVSGKGSAEVRWRRAIPELQKAGMYGGDMRKHMEQMRKQTFPDGTDEKEGAESIVIRTGDRVVKYRYARDLSGRVFDKIQWHNELFGDKTPYEVREVVADDDWNDRPPRIVLEQPYVEIREGGGEEARRRLVEDLRRRFGAENVTVKGDPASERMEIDAGPYHISDLKDLNIGIDERTGDYAVWDANIETRNGADAGGGADVRWRRTYTPNPAAQTAADNGPLTQREVDEINSVMPPGGRGSTSRDRQERAAREQASRDAFARAFHNAGTWQRVGMLLDKNTRRDAWRAVKESAIRKMQDAGLDLRKYEVRRFERQFGKPMSRWTNAERERFMEQSTYYAMDRAFGRKENLSLKLNQDYVKPLEKQIAENGLDEPWTDERGKQNIGADGKPLSKLDVYLMALHGGEYNRMIAERTARAEGGPVLDGSGRSTEYWERQLARFRNEGFDRKAAEAVRLVHEMNKAALQQMVDSGRISQKQADKWNELSPNYVPLRNSDAAHDLFEQLLFGGDIDEQTYRKAFSGTEYNHAAGRRSLADSPVINSIQQAEWAIARSMDNESRRSLAAQVRADPRMGTVVMQMSQSDFQEAQRQIAVFTQMEANGTITPAQRDRLARLKQNVADTIAGNRLLTRRRMLNQNSEVQSVIDTQGLEDDPNVGWVAFKENGDTKYIKLGHHELVDANGNATGNMDELTGNRIAKFVNGQSFVKLGGVMRFVRNLSRGFGMLRTSLSPTFLFSNFLADNGQALRNVFHTLGAGAMRTFEGHAADMGKNGAKASALRYLRGQLDPQRYAIDRFTKEWAEAGGQIGGFATESFGDIDERMAASLRRMQRRLSRGKGGWGEALKDGARALGERFQELNSAIEMATRISAYATMRENGMGVNDAVSYARDVTVNFNRKGELTPIFNALYVFSNANIQDMQRTGMTFTGSRAAKLNGTLFVLGLLSAALGFGQDEPDDEAEGKDTWENASEHRKQNGISFRVGGKVISLPLRGLARMPYYAGHKAFEALTGRRDAKDVVADIGSFIFSAAAEPLSTTSSLAQSVAPSILRPAVELIENKSFTGAPIHRTKMSETQVASEMGRQSTNGMAVWLARTLNSLTGGNRNRSGLVDVFPETLEQIGRGLAGTLGTDLMKGVTLANDIATFQAPATRDVPFVSRVASDMEKNSRRYHEAVTDFERDQKEYKDLAQEDPSVMAALRRNSPWFREGNEMWYNELDSLRKLNKKLMIEETKADGKEREALNELRMKTQGLFLWRLKHAPESDAPAKRAEYGQRNRLIDRMLRGRAAARKREERTARR